MNNINVEFSFVVRNLESGEDSRWIDLMNSTEEEVEREWKRVVNPLHDWELVDIETNTGLSYYWFQWINLTRLIELKNKLEEVESQTDMLYLIFLLENSIVTSLDELLDTDLDDGSIDYSFLETDSSSDADFGYAYVEHFGLPGDLGAYFSYESFGRDLRLDSWIQEMVGYDEDYDEELEDMLINMSDAELGYYYIDDILGGIDGLSSDSIEQHFDYEQFGRDMSMDAYYVETDDGYGGWFM